MENVIENQPVTTPTVNPDVVKKNVNIIGNAVEFASAVIVNIDSDLVAPSIAGESMTMESVSKAVAARLKMKLKIKD